MTMVPIAIGWVSGTALLCSNGRSRAVGWASVAALTAMLFAACALLPRVAAGEVPQLIVGGWPAGLGIRLRADWLAVGYAVPVLGLLVVLQAIEVSRGGFRTPVGPGLVVLLATGLTGLFLTGDMFNFYVFFEVAMACAFVLSALGAPGRRVRIASLFVVMNLLGSVLFLISVGALYHVSGSLDMQVVSERMAQGSAREPLLAASLLLAAFLIKLGIFPFHFWVPAVYGRSRAPAAALFAGALANIGSYGLLRFGGGILGDALRHGQSVLFVIGGATVLFGSLMAVARGPTPEVLAYSSIAQNGYILLAVAMGGSAGFAAAYVYAIVNSYAKTLLFACTGARGPAVAVAFFVGAMSASGLPPALGFVGKLALFRAAWLSHQLWLVALIVVGALLAFVYMFRASARELEHAERAAPSPRSVRLGLLLLAAGSLAVGLWPEPLLAAGANIGWLLTRGTP